MLGVLSREEGVQTKPWQRILIASDARNTHMGRYFRVGCFSLGESGALISTHGRCFLYRILQFGRCSARL